MKNIKSILFLICLLQLSFFSFSQIKECKTIPKTDEEMEQMPWWGNNAYLNRFADSVGIFKPNPFYSKESRYINDIPESNYKVPIQFWIYRDNNSNDNGMNDLFIQGRIDELNEHYLNNGTQIQFYRTCEINYVDNDNYLSVNDDEENDIIRDNYTEGVINIHYVRTLEGGAGVTVLFWLKEGIIVEQFNNTSTLAHEVGHYFGLEHTHRNYNKGKCRQEAVSRTRRYGIFCPLTGFTICEWSGDGFCDTPADPNLQNGSYQTACIFTDTNSEDK